MHLFHKYFTYDIADYDTPRITIIKQRCKCGKERKIAEFPTDAPEPSSRDKIKKEGE